MIDLGLGRALPASVKAELTSGWWRPRPTHRHVGVDLYAPVGTPVLAAAAGTLNRVQRVSTGDAAGIWVGILHPNGVTSRYMHLSAIAPGLAVGQAVRQGQVIGATGDTSEGPHLHFDLKAPASLLPAIQAAVGKPSTGWGPLQEPWGYGIPVEPWLPVDTYPDRTVQDAKGYGIPLYRDRAHGGLLQLALLAGIGWGLYRLLR